MNLEDIWDPSGRAEWVAPDSVMFITSTPSLDDPPRTVVKSREAGAIDTLQAILGTHKIHPERDMIGGFVA
jgi:hypothetical protein